MGDKNSFLLYTDYFEQIKLLNMEQRGILLTAIMAYQIGDTLPKLDAITQMCFSFIAADMRRNNEKYEEVIQKRREAGRKGGKQSQANQANASFASFAQANKNGAQANQANQADNVNDNENDNDNESVSVFNGLTPDTAPTIEEVRAYCTERKNTVDPARFIEYYQMREWKLSGGKPMKDWKAAVRYWETREKKEQPAAGTKFSNFKGRNDAADKMNEALRNQYKRMMEEFDDGKEKRKLDNVRMA